MDSADHTSSPPTQDEATLRAPGDTGAPFDRGTLVGRLHGVAKFGLAINEDPLARAFLAAEAAPILDDADRIQHGHYAPQAVLDDLAHQVARAHAGGAAKP